MFLLLNFGEIYFLWEWSWRPLLIWHITTTGATKQTKSGLSSDIPRWSKHFKDIQGKYWADIEENPRELSVAWTVIDRTDIYWVNLRLQSLILTGQSFNLS